jgi:hypothetical protein
VRVTNTDRILTAKFRLRKTTATNSCIFHSRVANYYQTMSLGVNIRKKGETESELCKSYFICVPRCVDCNTSRVCRKLLIYFLCKLTSHNEACTNNNVCVQLLPNLRGKIRLCSNSVCYARRTMLALWKYR